MISRSASRVHRSPITASALAMEHSRPRDTTGTFPASGPGSGVRLLGRIDNLAGKYRVVKSNLIVCSRDWPGGRRRGTGAMRDAVIVDAVRTPIGKGKPGGALAGVHPVDLHAHAIRTLIERAGIDPATVDDVISGTVGQ